MHESVIIAEMLMTHVDLLSHAHNIVMSCDVWKKIFWSNNLKMEDRVVHVVISTIIQLFYLIFRPLEVVFRYLDPQLKVCENY